MHHRPFARFHAVMAAMSALLLSNNSAQAQAAGQGMSKLEALNHVGGYQSRGKCKTKTHDHGGNRMFQRAALKKKNKAKHRKACRG